MGTKKNKAIILLTIVSLLLLIVDLWSTLRMNELVPYLEANPLYRYGGILAILGANMLLLGLLIWWYCHTPSPYFRFIVLAVLITVSLGRIFVVQNNMEIAKDPPTLEQAKTLTTEMKNEAIKSNALQLIWPYLVALLTFMLFSWDHKIEVRN